MFHVKHILYRLYKTIKTIIIYKYIFTKTQGMIKTDVSRETCIVVAF